MHSDVTIAVGHAALARGDWAAAVASFQQRLDADPSDALALEGRGLAAWWLDDSATVFRTRTEAFRLYREGGDDRAAGRVAVWLAWDHDAFHGDYSLANGWLQRARELLVAYPDTPEYAWLSVRSASFALLDNGNPAAALAHAAEAVSAARACASVDYEMIGRALRGFALATTGQVSSGMQELEAVNTAVLAGEVRDPLAIGLASCYLIAACDRVREYDRAAQWCARLREFCADWHFRVLFAVCRTQYAAACIWNGSWAEAETELTQASAELQASRPGMIAEALVRLGELRRRQGRVDEAHALFGRCGSHPLAVVGHANVALDRGEFDVAAQLADRYLRGLKTHNRTERAGALEVVIRARVALGQLDAARSALHDLQTVAQDADTKALHAAAHMCHGLVAMAICDADAARRHFEDAVDLFIRCGAIFERACAGIELAGALIAMGRTAQAQRELDPVIAVLIPMEAVRELAHATELYARLQTSPAAAYVPGSVLTPRECDVLRLIAKGSGNTAIATQLGISEHTVHRHVANMLVKLGVPSRAAAVAMASRLGLM